MESPGPLDAIKLVVQHRLVTATYLASARGGDVRGRLIV